MTLQATNAAGNRLQCLRELADRLAQAIDACEDDKLLPQLARQYREALREIDELTPPEEDNFADIIGELPKVR